MYRIAGLPIGFCLIVIAVSASCGRVSEKERGTVRERSSNGDVSAPCVTATDESVGPITAPSAPDTVPPDMTSPGIRQDGEFVRADPPAEIDINSGDVRGWRYRADGSAHYGIYESDLSKEIRRLDIPIPEWRAWLPVSGSHRTFFRSDVELVMKNLLRRSGELLRQLDEVAAADDERRDVLERFMASMRTEPPFVTIALGRMLIAEVRERHDLKGR